MSGDPEFARRRDAARDRLDELFGARGGDRDDRTSWFEAVYETAEGDAAAVPWADLAPKDALVEWLENNPGKGASALDVGCGLGDNAEALAAVGYDTTAFDLSEMAVEWAGQRFPGSSVHYTAADLFSPPPDWIGAFDLVHECYTVQALHGELRAASYAALAQLVKPGGQLLVLTRSRPEEAEADGPPWPLSPSELAGFERVGLTLSERTAYDVHKGERVIPHIRAVYEKPV
ncbi:Thiopurine S-methyltransferase (TPMT) [Stappia sp. ES.058]|nr:Thiopurine S-methyltransferase (TPMT) [Stappia sp. ES.058]